jgi:hypothetical protein
LHPNDVFFCFDGVRFFSLKKKKEEKKKKQGQKAAATATMIDFSGKKEGQR